MADTDESTDAAPTRSWLPSPGCVFAGTLMVCLVSVCIWIVWRGHPQQARLEYFRQLGGVVHTEPTRHVWLHDLVDDILGVDLRVGTDTYLDLQETEVTDASLERLSDLTNLQGLSLSNTQVTDDGLQHLTDLTNLKALRLNNTQVTDAGLQHLSGLTNLNWLLLHNTLVTDAGAEKLRLIMTGVKFVR